MTVKQRQHLLAYLGYYEGSVDGEWGPLSQSACTAFQKDFGGIQTDGFGGPETDQALKHAVAAGFLRREDATDTNVGDKAQTGTFWDEIEFFDREEFRCQCGGKYCSGFPVEPDEKMVRNVDEIRRRLGIPVIISSGIRCSTHNANIGGVANSEHCGGRAADLQSNFSPQYMKYVAEEVMGASGGIGIYDWGIHVDVGKYSRWNG